MIQHTLQRYYKDQSNTPIQLTETPQGNAELNLDVSVAAGATNQQYHIAFTRANLQSLCIAAGDVLTIKTNSSGSPTDTITLSAAPGQVLVWSLASDGLSRCPFSADVTTLYVTNGTANPINLKIRGLLNQ